jgi:quercetin dioxygenase-like cupin family protein
MTMKTKAKTIMLAGLVCAGTALAGDAAKDVMKVAPEHYVVRVDNANVRVVENTLRPGEKDGWHTHPAGWYYVTQPGKMKIVHADGTESIWDARSGEAGWMEAEAAHTSQNVGATTMGFILVEVKSAATPRISRQVRMSRGPRMS